MEIFIQIFKKNWITIFFSFALLSAAIMLGNKNSEIETLQNDVSYLEDQILTLESEKEIFLGEFVKALLKINNIACELEKVSEMKSNNNDYHKQLLFVKTLVKFPWVSHEETNIFKQKLLEKEPILL